MVATSHMPQQTNESIINTVNKNHFMSSVKIHSNP